MFSRNLTAVLVALIFLLPSCSPYNNTDLAGEWTAISLTEEGDSLAIELSDVGFSFTEDGQYTFSSTLEYQEAGSYRLDGPYLFTTDSLSGVALEKAVEIKALQNDSLTILMNDLGKERVMILQRD